MAVLIWRYFGFFFVRWEEVKTHPSLIVSMVMLQPQTAKVSERFNYISSLISGKKVSLILLNWSHIYSRVAAVVLQSLHLAFSNNWITATAAITLEITAISIFTVVLL